MVFFEEFKRVDEQEEIRVPASLNKSPIRRARSRSGSYEVC